MQQKLKKKNNKQYFTQATENAIILYNKTKDPKKKAKIFQDHIYYPFYKLAENIIHTFKFYYTDVNDIEDLKHDIVTVLLEEKIHKFDPDVGAKAYSYFGTIVKRWLINYNNKNYKTLKNNFSLEDVDIDLEETQQYVEEESFTLSEFFDYYINQMYKELDQLFSKKRDRQIADAVLTVFATRDDLDIFKKKAIYIYIKELVDCKTSHLTKVVKVLKNRFYEMYKEKDDEGLINNF